MTTDTAFLERIRSRGWRITPQRRAVACALEGAHVHLTAEELHAAARGIVPEISLATVYNALNELAMMGEVREVRVAGGSVRYDPNVDVAHHHLVCDTCGLIMDVNPRGTDQLRLPRSDQHGFRVAAVEVVFRGTCRRCAAL